VIDKQDPWEAEKYLKWADDADTDKNGELSNTEYTQFNKAQNFVKDTYINKNVMCLVNIGIDIKESKADPELAKKTREQCAAIKSKENCIDKCQWHVPEFNPQNEWIGIVKTAGLADGTKDMPLDKFVATSKTIFPDQADKMDKWAADADATLKKDNIVSSEEFAKFRTYIHKVGDIGCVSKFSEFESKQQNTQE